jgi:hypothetical protein
MTQIPPRTGQVQRIFTDNADDGETERQRNRGTEEKVETEEQRKEYLMERL